MMAIYVLWLRQIKRYFRSKTRIVGSLGQPILFLVALGFGFGPVYQKAGGGNYLEFLVSGIVAMSIIFTAIFSGIEIIWDRQFGFLKETLVAPVSRFSIVTGRILGGATVSTFQGALVLALSAIIGFRPISLWKLPLALLFMFLIALLFTALGTAIASRLSDMQGFQLIVNFLIMPLFFLSGAIFPLQGLNRTVTALTRIDPLTYGVDGLRGALINASHIGISIDIIVLACLTVILFAISSYLFSTIEL